MKTPATVRRVTRLVAGVSVLWVVLSGSLTARSPSIPGLITSWRPVTVQDAPRTPEPTFVAPVPSRPVPVAPEPPQRRVKQHAHTMTVEPPPAVIGSGTRGVASWYCVAGVSRCTRGYPPGSLVAAIRRDLLGHRGGMARVCAPSTGNCVTVRVVDCNCGPNANLIDLYGAAFSRLTPLSAGVVRVIITWP